MYGVAKIFSKFIESKKLFPQDKERTAAFNQETSLREDIDQRIPINLNTFFETSKFALWGMLKEVSQRTDI